VEQKGKSVKELDYSYWGMGNLQTLCSNCHRTKTSDEAHNRAKDRKNKDKVKWKSFREVFGV
jgi:5-methylcytosine-specific restriction endonuclease McrA